MADDALELAHETLVRRHELRGSMLPILSLAYNTKRHQLAACDESSIRLFSLRRELTVLWLDGPKPLDLQYVEGHDVYLVVYGALPESHPESSSAQILHASLAPLLRWRPHDTPTRCSTIIDETRFATSGSSELRVWQVSDDSGLCITPTAIVAEQSFSSMHSRCGILASALGTSVCIFTGLDDDRNPPTLVKSFDLADCVTCLHVVTQNVVAAGCADGIVCVWDLAKQAKLCEIRAHCIVATHQNSAFLSEDSTSLPDLDESTTQSRAPTTVANNDAGVFALCANVLAVNGNEDSLNLELFTCGVSGSRSTTHWLISAASGRATVQQLTTKLAPNEPPVRPDLENTVFRKHFKASIAASPMRARLCALQRRHSAPSEQRVLVTSHGGLLTIYEILEPEWRLATASDHIVQLHALVAARHGNAVAALTEGSRLETFCMTQRRGLLACAEPPATLRSAAVRDTTRRFPESFGRRSFNVLRGRAALSALTGPSADRVVFGQRGDSHLYACRSDGILEVFDMPRLEASTLHPQIPPPPITACCSCIQRNLLVVGDAGGALHVVTEEVKNSCLTAHDQAIACIVADDSNLIASASVDGVIKLWRLSSTKLVSIAHITITSSSITNLVLAASSKGSRIAVVGLESGMLESVPVPAAAAAAGAENPLPLEEHHQTVAHCMTVSVLDRAKQPPQGDLVLSASLDRTMCLWQMIDDQVGPSLLRFASLAHPIYAAILAFLPDLSRNAVYSCVADGSKVNRVCLIGEDGGFKLGREQAIEVAVEKGNTVVVQDEQRVDMATSRTCVQTQLLSLEAHAPQLTAAFTSSKPPATSPCRKTRASLSTKSLASSSGSSRSSPWLALPSQVGDRAPASKCSFQSWPVAHQDHGYMLTSTMQQQQQTSDNESDEESTLLPTADELQSGDWRLRAAFEDRCLGNDDIAASSLSGVLRTWWGDVLSSEEASEIGKLAPPRLGFREVCEKAAELCRIRHRVPNCVSGRRIDRVRTPTRLVPRKKLSEMSRERVRVTYNIMGEAVTATTIFSEDVAPGKGAVKTHRIESKQQRRRNIRSLSQKRVGKTFASKPAVLPDSLASYFAEPQVDKLRQMRSEDGRPSELLGQIASARCATMEVRKVFNTLRSSNASLAKSFYDLYRRSYGPRRVCEAKMVTLLDATADFGYDSAAVGAFGRFLGIAEDYVVPQRWARLYVTAVDWLHDRAMLIPTDNGALLVTRRNAAACTSHLSGDSPVVASAAISRVAAMPSLSSKEAAFNFWDECVDAEAVAEQLAVECSEAEKIAAEAARQLFKPDMLDTVLTLSGDGAPAAPTADEASTGCDAKMAEALRNLLNRFIQRDKSRGGAISEEDFFAIVRCSWPNADTATARNVATVFRDACDHQIVYVDLWAMLYTEVFVLRRTAIPALCDVYALALNQCVGIEDSLARCVQAYIAYVDFRATFTESRGAEADFTLLRLFPGDPIRISSIRSANLDPGTMRIVAAPTVASRQQRPPSSASAAYSQSQQYVSTSQDKKSCIDETPLLRQVDLAEKVNVKDFTPGQATQQCSYSRALCSLVDDRPSSLTSGGRDTTAGVIFSVVGSVGYHYVDDPFERDDRNHDSNGNPSPMIRNKRMQNPIVRQSVHAFAADSAIGQYSAIGRAAAPILPISSSSSSLPGRLREEELAKNRSKVAAARSVRAERRRQVESSLPEPDTRHEEKMRRLEEEAARRGDAARQAKAAAVAEREARAKAAAEAAAKARLEELERQQQLETKRRLKAEREAESKRKAEEEKLVREREDLRLAEARARADSKRRAFEAARDARIRDEQMAKQKALVEDQERRQRDKEAQERCKQECRLMREDEQCGYVLRQLATLEMHEAEMRRRRALLERCAALEAAERQEMNASEECGLIIQRQRTLEDEIREQAKRYEVECINRMQLEKERQQAEIEGMRLEEQAERERLALIESEANRRAAKAAEVRRRLDGVGRRKEENEKSRLVARRSSLEKAVQHRALSAICGGRANTADINTALRRIKQCARASNSSQLLLPSSRHRGHGPASGDSVSSRHSNTPPFFYVCSFVFSEDLVYEPFDVERHKRQVRGRSFAADPDNEEESAALGGLEELPKAARAAIEAATTDTFLKDSLSQLYADTSRNSDDIVDLPKIDHVNKTDWSRLFAVQAKSLSASARDLCSLLLSSSNAYSPDKSLTDAAKRKLAGDVPRPDICDRVGAPAATIQFLELGTVRTARATSSQAVFAIDVPEGRPILTIVLSCIDRDANLLVCKARLPTRCDFDWADTSLKAVKRVIVWPKDPKHGAGQFIIVVEPATPHGATFSLFAICSGLCDSSVPSDELKRLEPRLRIFNKLHATCSIEQLLDNYSLAYETAKAFVERQFELERTVSQGLRASDEGVQQNSEVRSPPRNENAEVPSMTEEPEEALAFERLLYSCAKQRVDKTMIPGKFYRLNQKFLPRQKSRHRRRKSRLQPKDEMPSDVADLDNRLRVLTVACSNSNLLNCARRELALPTPESNTNNDKSGQLPSFLLSEPTKANYQLYFHPSNPGLPRTTKRRLPYIAKAASAQC